MRPRFCQFLGSNLCSRECAHAHGDRRWCQGWDNCGCTGYSKKRRLLRDYMEYVSTVHEYIDERGLDEDFDDYLAEEAVERLDPVFGADSDEDPEEDLRVENAKLKAAIDTIDATQQTIALATACLDRGEMARKLEQSRMFAEDLLSTMARTPRS